MYHNISADSLCTDWDKIWSQLINPVEKTNPVVQPPLSGSWGGHSSVSWDSLLAKHWTHYRKVASSNPGRSGGRIFFSQVNFVCWLLFGVRSTPLLPQWHIKDPCHSAKSAGDRLHINTHTPLAQWSQSGLTMLLSRHSVGTYPETSSHATCQGTFGHSHVSLLSHCGLILA